MGLVVVNIVGLTPRLLAHMPRVRRVGEDGFNATLETILPAVTCSVQSTLLTGVDPSVHGIVGNGWYFRDLGEVFLGASTTAWCRPSRSGRRHAR